MSRFFQAFTLAALSASILSSCYMSTLVEDDDVYQVRNNDLPPGESMTDETSYAAFKQHKKEGVTEQSYYYEDRNFLYSQSCFGYYSMFPDCGCSFYAWNMYNPYFPPYYGHHFGPGYYNPYGDVYYDPFTGRYVYTSFYYPYGGLNLYPYNNFWPYSYWNGFGYGYGPAYGYPYSGNYSGSPVVVHNYHSGPRGSFSGFSPADHRQNQMVLKSMPNTTTTGFREVTRQNPMRSGQIHPQNVSRTTPIRYTPTERRPVNITPSNRTAPSSSPMRQDGYQHSPSRGNNNQPMQAPAQRGGNSPAPSRSGGGDRPSPKRN